MAQFRDPTTPSPLSSSNEPAGGGVPDSSPGSQFEDESLEKLSSVLRTHNAAMLIVMLIKPCLCFSTCSVVMRLWRVTQLIWYSQYVRIHWTPGLPTIWTWVRTPTAVERNPNSEDCNPWPSTLSLKVRMTKSLQDMASVCDSRRTAQNQSLGEFDTLKSWIDRLTPSNLKS